MIEAATLSGRVDQQDAFVGGDAGFAAMNARAGGTIGAPLAVPPLATVVRLARRLGILVARRVTIVDGDADLDCWARALPGDDGVTVTLADIRERAAAEPSAVATDVLPPPGADWIWETDALLRVRYVPVEAGARHGFDAAAALGQPLTRLFALDGDEGGLPILEALAARRSFDEQRATLVATGARVRLAAAVRHDAAGQFAGFVGATFMGDGDATAEPARALSTAFNARLDRALRRPLERIVASADSMNAETDGPLSPHYVDYAADIASAGRHLIGLVDDLVDLEAIERADFMVEPEAIDLADLARRAAGLLSVRAADAGVRIERPDAAEALPATGEFRRSLQVLVNLVGNAVRYAPRGSTVTVSVRNGDGRATASIVDRGKGIAAEDQARIFAKFERVDPGEAGGSGLGLYIARRLARAMGGDLTVESNAGEGARFDFSLPAR